MPCSTGSKSTVDQAVKTDAYLGCAPKFVTKARPARATRPCSNCVPVFPHSF